MLETVLLSSRPHPDVAGRLAVFERLIGSWDLIVTDIDPDGSSSTRHGEWHFGWALDGLALVDVWICPRRTLRTPDDRDGEWGMSLRFWDESIGRFRSTWHGPARGWVIPFLAFPTEDGLVLEGHRDDLAVRWSFHELTSQSFRWQAEEGPSGGPLRVRQRFAASRAAA